MAFGPQGPPLDPRAAAGLPSGPSTVAGRITSGRWPAFWRLSPWALAYPGDEVARSRRPPATGPGFVAHGSPARRSSKDVPAILQAIARTAARLCDATDAHIYRLEGDQLRLVAIHGSLPTVRSLGQEIPITRKLPSGSAILDRRTIHVRDVATAAAQGRYPGLREISPGHRTMLVVPLLRDDLAIGLIIIRRTRVQPFTAKQMTLLRTFADQAAIALENERLREALEGRNRELRVALEQQTATSELLKVIGRSTFDLQPVFETLAESAVRLCEAEQAFIFRSDGHLLRVVASQNTSPELRAFFERTPIAPGRGSVAGRAAVEGRTIHIEDVRTDPEYTWGARQVDPIRTVLAIPMLRGAEVLGVIGVNRHEVRPFSPSQVALLETFADQAAIAIENVRLFTELQARNRDLTESLEQQTATSEILRVISSSPTDVQPVFDVIASSAARLCDAFDVIVLRVDGDHLRLVAHTGSMPAGDVPLHRGTLGGRTVLEHRMIHVEDLQAAVDEFPEGSAIARERGHRTTLSVPLLREGVAIGNIQVRRDEVRYFSDRHIRLLQTFADQAVIAIENVRLFKELEVRNAS